MNALDLFLMTTLGFLGSFGHCAGMCGPIAVAFSLSHQSQTPSSWQQQIAFHLLLNLGRAIGYAIVGAGIGAVGSMVVASGQFAGIDSGLRQAIAIITGLMLIWFALLQLQPTFGPKLPILHPLLQLRWHDRLNRVMLSLSARSRWWMPAILGGLWAFVPCGFLYAAQIKAAATGTPWMGAATMLAFGLGTLPTMLGVGVWTARVSADRRSQLFRLGAWVTLTIGILTLLRTGEMVDLTGHAALLLLMTALVARPLSSRWPALLAYRRALGVGAFVLALAHTGYMMKHSLNWNLQAIGFMLPQHKLGMQAGIGALLLITPAALTSFDRAVQVLGKAWRRIHLLSVPALVLAVLHTGLIGSHYLGQLQWTWGNQLRALGLGAIAIGTLLVRSRWLWSLLGWKKWYGTPAAVEERSPSSH